MIDEIELKKLKNDYPDFFENIPPEIMETILSEETPSKISEICIKNGVGEEEKVEKIAYQITLVLLGQLSPKELPKALEKELNLDFVIAKKIYTETDQVIFSKIKESLTILYKEEVVQEADSATIPTKTPEVAAPKKIRAKPKEKSEEKSAQPSKAETTPDTYRESTE
jgi:hypothetical protein